MTCPRMPATSRWTDVDPRSIAAPTSGSSSFSPGASWSPIRQPALGSEDPGAAPFRDTAGFVEDDPFAVAERVEAAGVDGTSVAPGFRAAVFGIALPAGAALAATAFVVAPFAADGSRVVLDADVASPDAAPSAVRVVERAPPAPPPISRPAAPATSPA